MIPYEKVERHYEAGSLHSSQHGTYKGSAALGSGHQLPPAQPLAEHLLAVRDTAGGRAVAHLSARLQSNQHILAGLIHTIHSKNSASQCCGELGHLSCHSCSMPAQQGRRGGGGGPGGGIAAGNWVTAMNGAAVACVARPARRYCGTTAFSRVAPSPPRLAGPG